MKRKITILLSLAVTPLLIFISTTNYLFLSNERAFFSDSLLILTFLPQFLILFSIGIVLNYTSQYILSRALLLFYHLFGLFFMMFSSAHHNLNLTTFSTLIIFLLVSLTIPLFYFLFRRRKTTIIDYPIKIHNFFAILFLVFAGLDITTFATKFKGKGFYQHLNGLPDYKMNKATSSRPNIYHVVLDGFQTEALLKLLNDYTSKQLGGFTLFKNNLSNYEYTYMSTASFLTGRLFDYKIPSSEYLKNIFKSPNTFPNTLKNFGYSTLGIMNSGIITKDAKFDKKVFLNDYTYKKSKDESSHETLKEIITHLWFHRNIPRQWRTPLRMINLYPYSDDPILPNFYLLRAAEGMDYYISQESKLSDSGRYTYLHPVMPHRPYVLNSKCEQDLSLSREIGIGPAYIEQAECGLNLLIKLLKKLKETGRFKESLIVVNADHGEWYTDKDFKIDPQTGRARALLLVKPIGEGDENPLSISNLATSLLDIVPTVYSQLKENSKVELDGQDLFGNYKPYRRKFHTYSHHEEESSNIKKFKVFSANHDENIRLINEVKTNF